MGMLKRSSATRLVGWFSLAAVLVVAISVTAFAVTRSGAPTPPKRSLAGAVHAALSGRPVAGVYAQFAVDEHLLSGSSSTISVSPLAGASGSVWAGGGRVRVEIHSQRGTTELAYDGHQVTLYEPSHHVAYVLPIARPEARPGGETKAHNPAVPTIAVIDRALARLGRQAVLSGAIPSNIAGREAYVVRMSPRHNGSLVGAFELAWDAAHGVPLRFAVYPRGSSTAAIAVTVTHIQYGAVPNGQLTLAPARGTRIVRVHQPSRNDGHSSDVHRAPATGVSAVSRAVGFRLAAPAQLVGLVQGEVRSVDLGKGPAALLTYGRGLGTVFVLEQRATAGRGPLGSLPSVSVNGASGRELDTTLGTVVQFTRGGVTYTVVGSRPAAMITTAARSLG